jgi:hypothetical protein
LLIRTQNPIENRLFPSLFDCSSGRTVQQMIAKAREEAERPLELASAYFASTRGQLQRNLVDVSRNRNVQVDGIPGSGDPSQYSTGHDN